MTKIMQHERWEKFLTSDDMDFYEEYLVELTDEEIAEFYEENPDFMKEYNMYKERLPLLRDKNYREILRALKNSTK